MKTFDVMELMTRARNPAFVATIVTAGSLIAATSAFGQVPEGMVIEASDAVRGLENLKAAPNDFGQALINFVTYGCFQPGNTDNPSLLSAISRVINVIALFVMAWLAVLGGTNFIIQTANKGVPGGQVISSFWMPIRISLATILLIPLTSGYSTLQMGVTKVAETGNAHGSYVTKVGIDHLVNYGAYTPPLMASNKAVAEGLVAAELCMIHTNLTQRKQVIKRVKKQINERYIYSYDYHDESSKRRNAPQPNYCGMVEIIVPDAAETFSESVGPVGSITPGIAWATGSGFLDSASKHNVAASRALVKEFDTVFATLQSQAHSIAQKLSFDSKALADLQNGNTGEEAFTNLQSSIPDYVKEAAVDLHALYNTANVVLQGAIARTVNAARSSTATDGEGKGWAEEISELGWTALGTIYWQQSNDQKLINNIARTIQPIYHDPQTDGQFENDERFGDLIIRYHDMLALSKAESDARAEKPQFGPILSISEAGSSGAGWFKSWVAGLSQSIMYALTVDDDGDFVNKMQATGNNLVTFIDLSYHASIWIPSVAAGLNVGVKHTAEKAGEAGASVPFVGKLISAIASPASGLAMGLSETAYQLTERYSDLVGQLLGPLVIAGFILAVVLPSIPLFFWLLGVVSWILFYIECQLISPIWLAAHGTAEKEGWGSEHTRQGYMLMIGLYLNPILRTVGFFAVLVVIYPLGVLVGWMSSFLQGVIASGFLTSPFIIIGGMLILAFLGYSVAMRVFSLPNELFERGLRWVNGGQEVTGDENSTNRVNAMIASFGHKTEHGIGRGIQQSNAPTQAPPLNQSN